MNRYLAIAEAIVEADKRDRKHWSMGATYGATWASTQRIAEVLEACNFDLALRAATQFDAKMRQVLRVFRTSSASTHEGLLSVLRGLLAAQGLPEGFAKRTLANDEKTLGEWVLWLSDSDGIEWYAEHNGHVWHVIWCEHVDRLAEQAER